MFFAIYDDYLFCVRSNHFVDKYDLMLRPFLVTGFFFFIFRVISDSIFFVEKISRRSLKYFRSKLYRAHIRKRADLGKQI